jgi:hypothetical protein
MLTEDSIISTYVLVDDFYLALLIAQPNLPSHKPQRGFACGLNHSEIMTILLCFQMSHFRNFKQFYLHFRAQYKYLFPRIVSYSRFVTIMKDVSVLMFVFVNVLCKACTGLSFIDSTPVAVCKNIRINRNKVFRGLAKRGKSSTGWFFGFKLHIVISGSGELLSFTFTAGNTNDRQPVPNLCKKLFGKLFGDKGYLSKKLFEDLFATGVQLITNIKSNMKNKLIPIFDKLVLRKRFIIETIFDLLKNEFHLEHSRHRSHKNFIVNILGVLAAYCLRPEKPAIILPAQESKLLTIN